jgi:hypothetical protein
LPIIARKPVNNKFFRKENSRPAFEKSKRKTRPKNSVKPRPAEIGKMLRRREKIDCRKHGTYFRAALGSCGGHDDWHLSETISARGNKWVAR